LLHVGSLDADDCAGLLDLDARMASAGCRVLVSAGSEALDDVFGCIDRSHPEILVAPSRGERLVALGLMMAYRSGTRLRELDDGDRGTLQRLTEQVAQIAAQIDRLAVSEGPAFRLESPGDDFHAEGEPERRLIRHPRAPLPDPRLVRRIIRQRQLRAQFLDGGLFADPAWDILLDLTAARAEHQRVSVTSLCIASGVPATTALRWIGQMADAGLLERVEDETDRRRAFIQLSDKAMEAMARYFAELGKEGKSLV
jgi:DNA-binding MarR family transcriptional regulator